MVLVSDPRYLIIIIAERAARRRDQSPCAERPGSRAQGSGEEEISAAKAQVSARPDGAKTPGNRLRSSPGTSIAGSERDCDAKESDADAPVRREPRCAN